MIKISKAAICKIGALAAGVAMLGGCAAAIPTGTGPDGNAALTIMGPSPFAVMQKAGETCPAGYSVASNMIQAGMNYSMTIECRQRASVATNVSQALPLQTSGHPTCPTGYVCTPVAHPKCPAGYTCTPN